jgi:D-alanyl-D-alanine carboxypeptidase
VETGDGGLQFSVLDLVAWDRGIRSRAILKPDSWAEILTPVRLASGNRYPYGFGWELPQIDGRRVQRHRGVWLGFTNDITRYVDNDLTVIVLSNLVQPDEARILRFVEGVAAIVDPGLKPRELTPINDRDPDIALRVKALS